MEDEEIKTNKRVFAKGWASGFLFNIAIVMLVIFFVYFYVTPNMINSAFNTNITTGNDDLDNQPLSTVVPKVINAIGDKDLTLSKLETNYGIAIPVSGDLLESLKDVKLNELSGAITNKLSTMSLYELRDIIDYSAANLDEYGIIYYYNDDRLYYDEGREQEVDFNYIIDNDKAKLIISNTEVADLNDTIFVGVEFVPIRNLISEMIGGVDQLTIGDIRSFGIELPQILDCVLDNTKLIDIEQTIKTLKLNEVFKGDEYPWLSILDMNGPLVEISDNLSDAITTRTLRQLVNAGLIKSDIDLDKTIPNTNIKVGDLTINLVLTIFNNM